MRPYKVGTQVQYHGSQTDMHGKYIVLAHQFVPTSEYYPDGVAYELWPAGLPVKFGLRHNALYRVRRESISPYAAAELW